MNRNTQEKVGFVIWIRRSTGKWVRHGTYWSEKI